MTDLVYWQRWSVPLAFMLLFIAETLWPQREQLKIVRHNLFNIAVGLANMTWIAFVGSWFQAWFLFLAQKKWGLLNMMAFDGFGRMVLDLLLIDLFMYFWHRANHEWPFLWRWHIFHHSDTQMNASTSLRFHVWELAWSYVFRWGLFTIMGISASAIVWHAFLLFPVVLFHHSNWRFPERVDALLRLIIVSPSMHRIHHSNRMHETNSNYSSLFSFWDRIFKTHVKSADGPIQFGV